MPLRLGESSGSPESGLRTSRSPQGVLGVAWRPKIELPSIFFFFFFLFGVSWETMRHEGKEASCRTCVLRDDTTPYIHGFVSTVLSEIHPTSWLLDETRCRKSEACLCDLLSVA